MESILEAFINEAIEVEKVGLKVNHKRLRPIGILDMDTPCSSTTYFDNSLDAFSHSYHKLITT